MYQYLGENTTENGSPIEGKLTSIDFVGLADLTQDQRNTLTSTRRRRTLYQYNAQELRDLFLETFFSTKTAADNPLM